MSEVEWKRRAENAEAENALLREAIRQHRADEQGRHVAYRRGQMESVADERLWAALSVEAEHCPRCRKLITEWKRWGERGGLCEDCEEDDNEMDGFYDALSAPR